MPTRQWQSRNQDSVATTKQAVAVEYELTEVLEHLWSFYLKKGIHTGFFTIMHTQKKGTF